MGFTLSQAGEMGLRVGVIFIPLDAGGVLNQLLKGDIVPGAAFQVGLVIGDPIIKRMDFTLLNRYTDQGGDHRFTYRAGGPQRGVGIACAEIFVGNLTLFEYQKTGDVLALQVIIKIVGFAIDLVTGIGERFLRGQSGEALPWQNTSPA